MARLPSLLVAMCIALSITDATAQPYPSRPITMIVPFSAGGPADFVGRLVAESMSKTLGTPITIENIGGAGGTIAAGRVARAPADGYTIMVYNQGFAASPGLYASLPYDINKDFRMIGLISRSPMVLISRRDLANDVKSLIDIMKQKGDQMKFAHAGVGGVAHLCSLVFDTAIGATPSLVPYRGGSQAMNDIIAGHVDLYCGLWDTYESVKNNLTKGHLVLGSERLAAVPDIPSSKELGLKDLDLYAWYALFAPASTPDPIIAKLNEALRVALADPSIQKRFVDTGSVIFPPNEQTPAAGQVYFDKEMKRLLAVMKANDVKPQ